MVNRSRSVLVGLMIAACAMFALAANEPNPKPDALERGIQAYLSGNDAGAEQFLAEATRRDPHDPRPLYFRALCLRHQGRSREARADFILAASLEARSQGSYPVDESLARALAADRLKLQQYRWHVRSPFDATDATSLSSDTRRPATIDIRTDADSLRQPVSVPLDRLVQPVSLSELVKLATEAPAAEPPRIEHELPESRSPNTSGGAPAASGNPFGDDPRAAPAGKVPAGKLLGIFGRAIAHAAPVPSLDGIRQQLPTLSAPAANHPTPAAEADFGSGAVAPAEEEDPFSQPAEKAAAPKNNEPPAEAAEEDPFG